MDKDIYVVNEKLDQNKFLSLFELIETYGGLLRIPFLLRT